MTTKADLYHLIDDLPESELASVARFLANLRIWRDPRLPPTLREAPWDDEPKDPAEAAGDKEAWDDLRAGRVVSNEDLRRELGW